MVKPLAISAVAVHAMIACAPPAPSAPRQPAAAAAPTASGPTRPAPTPTATPTPTVTPPNARVPQQPATLVLDSIGTALPDGTHVLADGSVRARVRVRRGTHALGTDTRWTIDFTDGRTYRCNPTLGAADQTALAALAPGGESLVELHCPSIAVLNGSPRAYLWPGAYRAQITMDYRPGGTGRSSAYTGFAVRVDGTRAQPPARTPREATLGRDRIKWIASSITQRSIQQGARYREDQPPPIARNARFTFELANRGTKPLVIADWELFVVGSGGALSWDAIVITPRDWDRVVAPRSSVQVELTDGVFPPALASTRKLRMVLRVVSAGGNTAWIGGPTFDVTDAVVDPNVPPPP